MERRRRFSEYYAELSAGHTLYPPHPSQQSCIRRHRYPGARARRWPQRRGVQRSEHHAAASSAVSRNRISSCGSLREKASTPKMRAAGGLSAETYTVDVYREFQRNNQSFQAVTAYQTFYNSLQYKLTGIGEPRQLDAVEVAGNFFPTLGVRPCWAATSLKKRP